ncbi:MAG TPA: FAD-linked oxidase C-terminal domain-containing protein [Gemmataceae bacterium]|nr:FAD-linked oxidase C-terminal domain-containing protein [Gemmataceae bacterium]
MDPAALRTRLRDDLRRDFRGELHVDAVTRTLYSTDASIFQVEPLAVAVPRDEDDLRTLVRYAHERSIPLVPRGAGTGLAGASLGPGIVIDLSVHFRAIQEMAVDWVRVQAGVTLERLNAHLAKSGRRLAIDLESSASCTIGSTIATDARGNTARHGSMREQVRRLRVVWDDGTTAELAADDTLCEPPGRRTHEILEGVRAIVATHADAITASRLDTGLKSCGYRVDRIGDPSRSNHIELLVGSEGTLAILTEATLRTIPIAPARQTAVFGFPSLELAIEAGLIAARFQPSVCEVVDHRYLALARPTSLDDPAEALLFVEFESDTCDDARELVRATSNHIVTAVPQMSNFAEHEVGSLEAICRSANTASFANVRGPRPLPIVEDLGVAPTKLSAFVAKIDETLKRFELAATLRIRVSTGHVDLRPLIDPTSKADSAKLWPLADELCSLAISMGGTISAHHGIGLARTPWVARQFPQLVPAFREVKQLFDPRGILNSGKIVGPDPGRPAWPLRKEPDQASEPAAKLPLVLQWATGEMTQAIDACNACGVCRTEEPAERMCPTFRATHAEAAAPRAKANVFRAIVESAGIQAGDDDVRKVADLCVNCKMCAQECPSRVDVPKLMLEAKAANHQAHGLRRSAWFLARMDGLAELGSRIAPLTNMLLGRPLMRWGLERIFGLARGRTLPAFAFRPFLRRARRRGLTRRPTESAAVALFVDTFANVCDPTIAEATVAVLQHNNVAVYVPHRQRGTGATALVQGDTDVARERLRFNVRHLAEAARAGDTIVCPEPTAALFFRIDALGLSDDPDVQLVASRTMELTSYLWGLHAIGNLRTDFQPLPFSLGHHVPCHVKALGDGVHGPGLLGLIPQLQVNKIDVSCSGMAGTYGLNARNLPISLAAGQPMLDELAKARHQHGSSECSACRLQMQFGTGKRALHPVQFLALAYGLMPHLADWLQTPFGGRVCR